MRRLLPLCAGALALAVLGACGEDESGGTAGTSPTENPATLRAGVPAELTITVASGEGEEPVVWTLTCAPTGGDHPERDAACATLASLDAAGADPLRAVRAVDMVCTEQYGGPQTATVTGTLNGAPVTAALSRVDGCEIARWDQLAPLLGDTAAPD